jgi:hypothetical protein
MADMSVDCSFGFLILVWRIQHHQVCLYLSYIVLELNDQITCLMRGYRLLEHSRCLANSKDDVNPANQETDQHQGQTLQNLSLHKLGTLHNLQAKKASGC